MYNVYLILPPWHVDLPHNYCSSYNCSALGSGLVWGGFGWCWCPSMGGWYPIDREMCGWYPIDREMCGWYRSIERCVDGPSIEYGSQSMSRSVDKVWRVDTKIIIIEDEAIRQMIVKHTKSIELSTYTNKHPGIAITPGWWDLVTKEVDKELVTKEVFYCCASSPFLPNKHKQTS